MQQKMRQKEALNLQENEPLVFEEEQYNLSAVEGHISQLAGKEASKAQKLQKEIDDTYVADNDDLSRKQYLIETCRQYRTNEENFRRFTASPYFGRFDMEDVDGTKKTYFVGKEGLEDGAELIVLDWRSPMGGTFYNKQERHFQVNGYDYELLLRRAIDIQAAQLISVRTEYDLANLSLEGEVVDPFLLSVLRSRRRDYRLTDIIQTIQENQNNIIRRPMDESFVVQGCAGSGKTMILLHRLSYLAFQNKHINFGRFCILTPNDNFNIHVNELTKSLGLDKIKRYTVEEFYAGWIRHLARFDKKPGPKSILKVEPVNEHTVSEKLLPNQMLSDIYSFDFQERCISFYHGTWSGVQTALTASDAEEVFKKRGIPFPDFSVHTFSVYRQWVDLYSALMKEHDTAAAVYKEAMMQNENIEKDFQSASLLQRQREEILEAARGSLFSFLKEREQKERERAADLEAEILQNRENAVQSKKAIEQNFVAIQKTDDDFAALERDLARLSQASSLPQDSTPAVTLIRRECAAEVSRLDELNSSLKELAIYNFGKRSQIKSELNREKESLSKKVAAILQSRREENDAKNAELRKSIAQLDDELSALNSRMASMQSEKKKVVSLLSLLEEERNLFTGETPPNIKKSKLASKLEEYSNLFKDYQASYFLWAENCTPLQVLQGKRAGLEKKMLEAKQHLLSKEDLSILTQANDRVMQLDMEELLKAQVFFLKKTYKKYQYTGTAKRNYRHTLYLKLLLCSLYYETPASAGYYVNIDEAQDLAPTEYQLLKNILGDRTVFNLYGDVNQLIYEYKGISDWNSISGSIADTVYFLNQNYRNTLQITDYCNKVFEAEVQAVGLSGSEVTNAEFKAALKELSQLKASDPAMRVAVLYKQGLVHFDGQIKKILRDNVVFGTIAPEKISVITVEDAKGLEFDAVLAVTNFMSINEKYIAFTRALDHLFTTECPDAIFKTDEEENKDASQESSSIRESFSSQVSTPLVK